MATRSWCCETFSGLLGDFLPEPDIYHWLERAPLVDTFHPGWMINSLFWPQLITSLYCENATHVLIMGAEAFKEITWFFVVCFLYVLQLSVRVITCMRSYHLPDASWPTTEGLFGKAAPCWINKLSVLVLPWWAVSKDKTLRVSDQLPDEQSQSEITSPLPTVTEWQKRKMKSYLLCCAPQREGPRRGSQLLWTGSFGLPPTSRWP